METEVKDRIEEQLRYYPTLKSQIKNKKNQILYQEGYAVKAINYSSVSSGKTNKFYSDVENFIYNKLDKYPDLVEMEIIRDTIENSYNSLSDRQKAFVEFKYFQDLTDLEIVFRMRDYEQKLLRRLCKNDENSTEDYICKEYSVPTIQRMKLDVLKQLKKAGICDIEQTMSNK